MTKAEIIEYLYDNNVRADITIEQMADDLTDHKTKPQIYDFFRNPTVEERKAVADYIDSISVPTGVNVFDLMDEPQTDWKDQMWAEAVEQREHDILYEPTYNLDDGSM